MKKIAYKLHLYLGLLSGIVVFIVCITGCIYVFKDEIVSISQPWRSVEPQHRSAILPSQAISIANTAAGADKPTAITYGEKDDAIVVDYYDPTKGVTNVYINPYDGSVVKCVEKRAGQFDFFSFIIDGHRRLWLPKQIGKPIVGVAIIIFVATMITGLLLWWPRRWNTTTVKRNFTVKRKRIVFGLHNALGGYAFIILMVVSLTGLVWSFGWYSSSVYWLTSGGKELQPYVMPHSTTSTDHSPSTSIDSLHDRLKLQSPEAKSYYFALPAKSDDVIRVSISYDKDVYYKTDNLFFDQYTLEPRQGQGVYAGRYDQATAADKFRRMNYDIHTGRVWGISGKILLFIASLIGASLPVTGVVMWVRKFIKKRK